MAEFLLLNSSHNYCIPDVKMQTGVFTSLSKLPKVSAFFAPPKTWLSERQPVSTSLRSGLFIIQENNSRSTGFIFPAYRQAGNLLRKASQKACLFFGGWRLSHKRLNPTKIKLILVGLGYKREKGVPLVVNEYFAFFCYYVSYE